MLVILYEGIAVGVVKLFEGNAVDHSGGLVLNNAGLWSVEFRSKGGEFVNRGWIGFLSSCHGVELSV